MTPDPWRCPRRVGFLFPHACERPSPVGCPDCQNGQIVDPYAQRTDRYGYDNYDNYQGVALAGLAVGAAGVAGMHDFTEADGEQLIRPQDEFENDLSAS